MRTQPTGMFWPPAVVSSDEAVKPLAVAGSADIGRHCTIGAAAVILGHLRLAHECLRCLLFA